MVARNSITIKHSGKTLSDSDVDGITARAKATQGTNMILVDLRGTAETSTAALVKLILLRRRLQKAGRDLCIAGLQGQAEAMYQIYRMMNVLPRVNSCIIFD